MTWQKVAKKKFVHSLQLTRGLGSVGQWNLGLTLARESTVKAHTISPSEVRHQ